MACARASARFLGVGDTSGDGALEMEAGAEVQLSVAIIQATRG